MSTDLNAPATSSVPEVTKESTQPERSVEKMSYGELGKMLDGSPDSENAIKAAKRLDEIDAHYIEISNNDPSGMPPQISQKAADAIRLAESMQPLVEEISDADIAGDLENLSAEQKRHRQELYLSGLDATASLIGGVSTPNTGLKENNEQGQPKQDFSANRLERRSPVELPELSSLDFQDVYSNGAGDVLTKNQLPKDKKELSQFDIVGARNIDADELTELEAFDDVEKYEYDAANFETIGANPYIKRSIAEVQSALEFIRKNPNLEGDDPRVQNVLRKAKAAGLISPPKKEQEDK